MGILISKVYDIRKIITEDNKIMCKCCNDNNFALENSYFIQSKEDGENKNMYLLHCNSCETKYMIMVDEDSKEDEAIFNIVDSIKEYVD